MDIDASKEESKEYTDEEIKRLLAEYEERKKQIEQYPVKYDDITVETGITALSRAFTDDKRVVNQLAKTFNDALSFMESHTDLEKDEILRRINSKVWEIELVDGYEENPEGIGYVDNMLGIVSVNKNILTENQRTIYEFIRHEMTHMLSGRMVKKFWQKRPELVSGYSKEEVLGSDTGDYKKENEYFNEAVVEIFCYQDDDYREEEAFGYNVYTNQDFNEGYYAINSNIIRQMMLARGIDRDTLFKGLYDTKTAEKVERKFKKKVFRQSSENMDDISDGILQYYNLDNSREDGVENGDLDERISSQQKEITDKIKESERTVIDKILMPRLRRLSPEQRAKLLSEYDKFIICERDYFRQRTGYHAIANPSKKEKTEDKPWLQKVDVDIQAVLDRQGERSPEETQRPLNQDREK